VRFAYFDEAGIGDPAKEPFTVVAGIMLHVDEQYSALQQFILDMADALVGKDRPLDFVFHATDLWHGGKFFPREKWPLERRMEILGHICSIPEAFQFQVFYTVIERAKYPPQDLSAKNAWKLATRRAHVICFLGCLQQVDGFMREALPDEKSFAVVEEHNDHRRLMKDAARFLGNRRLAPIVVDDPNLYWRPYEYLIDEPLFQSKSGVSPLQIADACAFIIAKHLGGDRHAEPHLEKLKPRMAVGWRTDFFTIRPSVSE
jgi:hypothetical protein